MKKSKTLWRALLFFVLLAALCGSLALPVENIRVIAAPQAAVKPGDVVISEFRTRGSAGATDEFIELFNATTVDVTIGGWILKRSSGCGSTIASIATIPAGVALAPGEHYLVGGSSYDDPVAPDLPNKTLNIADDGGIALFLADGSTLIDRVGLCATTLYVDGSALIPLITNVDRGYERKLGGASASCQDNNNNSADFQLINPSVPQNLSSPAIPCVGVINVASTTADGTYSPGATINISVTFSGNVTVTGTPTLLLETGATDHAATYASAGSGSSSLSFSYTVMAGDTSSDLDYVANNSLVLNGGTITGTTGNAILTLPDPATPGSLGVNNNIVIDNGLAPTVTINQDSTQSDPTSVLPIKFAIVFSEPITTSSFTVADNTQTGTASGITWTITDSGDHKNFVLQATAITNAGTLIPSIAAGKVTDLAGNNNTASTSTDNTVTYSSGSSSAVLINEVAWSGTAASTNDEWIELHNTTSSPIDITNWKLYGDDNTLNNIGSPNIPLSGTIPAGGYFLLEQNQQATDVTVTANTAIQVNSTINLLNTGERLYLKDNSGNTIDTANLDGGAWPAGTASVTTTSPPAYASMERVGTTGNQWVTYQGTVPVAHNRNGGDIKGTPGFANWINTASVTTITSDLPDPSAVNANVTVRVTVIGGTSTPTGTVTVTATSSNGCTITLATGTGSCTLSFSAVGTKTITATYHSTNGLPLSNDTESHVVSTAGTIYRTPTPIPPPPPQLVVINEFVPRPGHDWNQDGAVNVDDEYIELLNHGTVDVNLSGWRLDDEVNVGSNPYSLPSKTIKPGERIVFYGSETGLLLGDGGDGVRLLKPNGQLIDAYNYTVARYPDESFCRLPDNGGADDWNQFCFPTPGIQNSLSGNFAPPSANVSEQPSCPISDTLPDDFVQAECDPFGNNIWRPEFWDNTGWYNEKNLPSMDGKWPVFAD